MYQQEQSLPEQKYAHVLQQQQQQQEQQQQSSCGQESYQTEATAGSYGVTAQEEPDRLEQKFSHQKEFQDQEQQLQQAAAVAAPAAGPHGDQQLQQRLQVGKMQNFAVE